MNKIFGIGLSRTGTLSLSKALTQAGITMIHYPSKKDLFNLKVPGACDLPIAINYKKLDKHYPNSKFIYTIREKEEWLISIKNHFTKFDAAKKGNWQKSNRIAMYGRATFNKEIFSRKYDEHDQDVKSYFKGKEQDLLIINICAGEGWEKLLPFVGISKKKTLETFPHEHKRKNNHE